LYLPVLKVELVTVQGLPKNLLKKTKEFLA